MMYVVTLIWCYKSLVFFSLIWFNWKSFELRVQSSQKSFEDRGPVLRIYDAGVSN
jgi:hypothetical protein